MRIDVLVVTAASGGAAPFRVETWVLDRERDGDRLPSGTLVYGGSVGHGLDLAVWVCLGCGEPPLRDLLATSLEGPRSPRRSPRSTPSPMSLRHRRAHRRGRPWPGRHDRAPGRRRLRAAAGGQHRAYVQFCPTSASVLTYSAGTPTAGCSAPRASLAFVIGAPSLTPPRVVPVAEVDRDG